MKQLVVRSAAIRPYAIFCKINVCNIFIPNWKGIFQYFKSLVCALNVQLAWTILTVMGQQILSAISYTGCFIGKSFFLFLKKCNNKFLEKLIKATLKSSSRLIKSILLATILPSWYYTNILDLQVFYIHVEKYFELCLK